MTTTTTAAFKKGEQVYFLRAWNRAGAFHVDPLVVHSCGAKQMTLVDTSGTKFQGMFFYPREEQGQRALVARFASLDDAKAEALHRSALWRADERARLVGCLERNPDACEGYRNSIAADITKLDVAQPAVLVSPRCKRVDGVLAFVEADGTVHPAGRS